MTLTIPCRRSEAEHLWLAGQTQEVPVGQRHNKNEEGEIQIWGSYEFHHLIEGESGTGKKNKNNKKRSEDMLNLAEFLE